MTTTVLNAVPMPAAFPRQTVELAARWYVFIFLNLYGIGKILGGQFYRRGRLPEEVANTLLGQAGAFELAWTFMGYSFAYILFIGISQIVGAWMLLWERTKLLGVAILMPILVNIVVFDIIFLDTYGALASAVIYLTMLLVILACNQERVRQSLQALIPGGAGERLTWRNAGAALLLMAVLFAFDQALVNFFGHGKG